MLTANRDLMQQAREALKGKWGLAVVGNLIYLALITVAQFIPLVGPFANLIITGPLVLGLTCFFLALSRKQEAALSQIFDGLQRFVDALITFLLMVLFIFLWSLLLIIPGIMAALSYALTFFSDGGKSRIERYGSPPKKQNFDERSPLETVLPLPAFFRLVPAGGLDDGHRVFVDHALSHHRHGPLL